VIFLEPVRESTSIRVNSMLYVAVLPSVGPAERDSEIPPLLREASKLCRDIQAISESEIYVEPREGFDGRWKPIRLTRFRRKKAEGKTDEETDLPALAPVSPDWVQLIIGVTGSSIWITALYKTLKTWIEAKADREIKLTVGEWQVRFKGLSHRQVVELFRALQTETERRSGKPAASRKVESRRIGSLLKELNIPA